MRKAAIDVLGLGGIGLFIYGAELVSRPLAIMVAGAVLTGAALAIARKGEG